MPDRPTLVQRLLARQKFTRMRGIDPGSALPPGKSRVYPAWGSTLNKCSAMSEIQVYPACADRPKMRVSASSQRLFTACPGIDRSPLLSCAQERFTPHARGSTLAYKLFNVFPFVYPACAGIDPSLYFLRGCDRSLPRMRGDRPCFFHCSCHFSLFTPHARGSTSIATIKTCCCHVYPACAGIDLCDCLRMRTT